MPTQPRPTISILLFVVLLSAHSLSVSAQHVLEQTFWDSVSCDQEQEVLIYLDEFPNGAYIEEAKECLKDLDKNTSVQTDRREPIADFSGPPLLNDLRFGMTKQEAFEIIDRTGQVYPTAIQLETNQIFDREFNEGIFLIFDQGNVLIGIKGRSVTKNEIGGTHKVMHDCALDNDVYGTLVQTLNKNFGLPMPTQQIEESPKVSYSLPGTPLAYQSHQQQVNLVKYNDKEQAVLLWCFDENTFSTGKNGHKSSVHRLKIELLILTKDYVSRSGQAPVSVSNWESVTGLPNVE